MLQNAESLDNQKAGQTGRERQAGQPSRRAASLDHLLRAANLSEQGLAGSQVQGPAGGLPSEGRHGLQALAGSLQAARAQEGLPAQPAWSRQVPKKAQLVSRCP